ncbi:MAG: M36 family metallopeptidase [Nocardioidaceae bacterium]
MSLRPLILAASAALLIPGAVLAAPAASGGSIDAGPESAVATSPEDLAINYVEQHAKELGLKTEDVSDVFVLSTYPSKHTGVTHVSLNQRFQGLEVFGGQATVNVNPDGSILYVGNSFVPNLRQAGPGAADLQAVEAVAAAADELNLDRPGDVRVTKAARSAGGETVLSGGDISNSPIPARQGWQPTKDGLRLGWQLVIDDASGDHLWNATIDARTGELLNVDDWVISTPRSALVSSLARTSAAESAAAENLAAGRTEWLSSDQVEDGTSYRAYPQESPNDADRVLFENPADGLGSPFGWHDTNGEPGAEFRTTRGNNVRAYLDEDGDDSPDFGGQPDGGADMTFDDLVDLNEHPQNYRDATVTNLFFWCNTIHDLWYRYGFDEASGNFQANNYGRGGFANDEVRCQAQSGAGTNNANFRTPVDGDTMSFPRMRMYLWPGNQFGSQNQLVIDGVGEFATDYARVTPAPTVAGMSGLTFVDGGTGCDAGTYPDQLPTGDWAAMLDGDLQLPLTCDNVQRIEIAEDLGASAVVVQQGTSPTSEANRNNPRIIGGILTMFDSEEGDNDDIQDGSIGGDYRPSIPAVSVGENDGETIRAAIAAGPTTGSLRKHPAHPGIRDGDFDIGVIMHEYGHGLSNRLTGGPTINCLGGVEQMGEGWSDYMATAALIDPEVDDPDGTRGMGTYVIFQDDRGDGGIRNRPYSRTMDIQPFTYDSIRSNSWLGNSTIVAPHQVGHGWASILWDLTWNMIDTYGFNPNLYDSWDTGGNNLAYQLVIDGMKMQGCFPGFVDGRNGILAADQALTGGENQCMIWAAFARRGLGFSAQQGSSANRDDNAEAMDTHPDCAGGFTGPVRDEPQLNRAAAGRTVPMNFVRPELMGLDILASNSPYSRQVNCETLATEIPGSEFVTPGALPVAAETPGNSTLTRDPGGRYQYPWQTEEGWVDTCREVVLTLDNGEQHRAYFRFVEPD